MLDGQHARSHGRGPRREFTSLVSDTSEDQIDGSFKMHLTLPDGCPLGEAHASVENCDYATCTNVNSSCASTTGYFHVEP